MRVTAHRWYASIWRWLGIDVVIAPLSLRNSITTSPSAGSSRKVGLMIGEGIGAGSDGSAAWLVTAFGSTALSLPARATATAWTEISLDMAALTAQRCAVLAPDTPPILQLIG